MIETRTARHRPSPLARAFVAALLTVLVGCGEAPMPPRDAGRDGGGTPDAGDAGVARPDAGGFAGLGRPCTTREDCPAGGSCVPGLTGRVCTQPCEDHCPTGWACRVTDTGDALASVCVPLIPPLCSPCTTGAQCPGGDCVQIAGEGHCAAICFEGSCPVGYHCAPDPQGMRPYELCVPDTGSCTCTPENDGAVRTCSVGNAIGTCQGTERCVAGEGWVGCDARTPELEVCDGLDNDCDFLIDDGVDGAACTNEVAGVGSCPGTSLCLGEAGIVCQGPTPSAERCNYVDDDCNGVIDDGFAGLGTVCSAGVGACFRNGVIRCTADQAATECSAAEGAPTSESCNGIDDDCDGRVDEAFPELGRPCSGGVGLCARTGTTVCASSGVGTACSVAPGMPVAEVCNRVDDDCDGSLDEDFRNPTSGAYDRDTACGSCGVDCTVIFGRPNAFGTCDVAGGTRCTMTCTAGAFDLNGVLADGCEFVLDSSGIYVSIGDRAARDDAGCGLGPVGTGTGRYPCRTIAQGLARAAALGRSGVLVAAGIYDEAVSMVSGRSLLGGYRPDTWERDLSASGTQIRGVATMGDHQYTVRAVDITAPTLFEGFVVRGSVNGTPRGNSYAIYVSGSSSSLTIRNNLIFGGRGGPGGVGALGSPGQAGADGVGRDSTGIDVATYDALIATGAGSCDASNNRQYTNGGARTCAADGVSGGNGGGNRCPPAVDRTQYSAINGFTGQAGDGAGGGAAGAGGAGGFDATLTRVMGSTVCFVPTFPSGEPRPVHGDDGAAGRNGAHGAAGTGCGMVNGSVSAGHWSGSVGTSGAAGRNGGGGGGGGAGGGAHCDGTHCDNRARLGGHGGGGGSGGCGGAGGAPGLAGGGAFGIFLVGGASAPVIRNNTIVRGEGGAGGAGGSGGAGGEGGMGAAGGTTSVFCAGRGGRGGNGGSGGHGAGGGGGCGGASFGIYSSGLGTPGYCDAAAGNSFSGGAGGAGGPGGYSLANTGAPGGAGALTSCGAF